MFAIADGLCEPMELEVEEFLGGETGGWGVGVAESFGEVEEREGDRDGDVETFGEAVHGYFDVFVGKVDGLLREPGEFGAEDECQGCGDVEVGDEGVVGVGCGGDDAVAAAAKFVVGGGDVRVGVVVDPFGGANSDVARGVEGIVALDDMDVLDAETVAGAEDGCGVVGLVDVFECHGDVAGAEGGYAVDELAAVVGNELRGGFVECFFGRGVEGGEKLSQGRGGVEVDAGHFLN